MEAVISTANQALEGRIFVYEEIELQEKMNTVKAIGQCWGQAYGSEMGNPMLHGEATLATGIAPTGALEAYKGTREGRDERCERRMAALPASIMGLHYGLDEHQHKHWTKQSAQTGFDGLVPQPNETLADISERCDSQFTGTESEFEPLHPTIPEWKIQAVGRKILMTCIILAVDDRSRHTPIITLCDDYQKNKDQLMTFSEIRASSLHKYRGDDKKSTKKEDWILFFFKNRPTGRTKRSGKNSTTCRATNEELLDQADNNRSHASTDTTESARARAAHRALQPEWNG